MKLIKNKLNTQNGAVMILAIFVMIIVMMTVAVVSTQVNNQIIGNKNTREQVTIRYSAEAGVEKTIADVCSQLEKELNNLSYEPPGDPGSDAEDNAVYKYINIAANNLRLGADQISGSDNSNLKTDIIAVYNKIIGDNGTISKATPINKLIKNKYILKYDINSRIIEIENIILTANNKNRLDESDEYLYVSLYHLKLASYTLEHFILNHEYKATTNSVLDLKQVTLENHIKLGYLKSSRDNGLEDAIKSLERLRNDEYKLNDDEKNQVNNKINELRNLQNKVSNTQNKVSDLQNKMNDIYNALIAQPISEERVNKEIIETIRLIETINTKTIIELQLNIKSIQYQVANFKIHKEAEPVVLEVQENMEMALEDLEHTKKLLIDTKCKLGKTNNTGEVSQAPNPNPTPELPNKIVIDIQEATMDLGNNVSYKRYGFTIEVPIEWQEDGNGGYQLKDIQDISQDIVAEGFMEGYSNRTYKINANITFSIQKGDDGKLYVRYKVNSWNKV